MRLLLFFLLTNLALRLPAQTLSGVSTAWSDSFVEWEIFVRWPDSTEVENKEDAEPEEEKYGDIRLRWLNVKNDWTEWDYSFGETERGTIKQKWKDDPTQWELRTYDGSVITMRTMWPNDPTEWRITDNSIALNFKSRWTNQWDEWLVKDSNYGTFYLYTLRSRDPRDWAIEDKLNEDVSGPMKIAMLFIAIFQASPKM